MKSIDANGGHTKCTLLEAFYSVEHGKDRVSYFLAVAKVSPSTSGMPERILGILSLEQSVNPNELQFKRKPHVTQDFPAEARFEKWLDGVEVGCLHFQRAYEWCMANIEASDAMLVRRTLEWGADNWDRLKVGDPVEAPRKVDSIRRQETNAGSDDELDWGDVSRKSRWEPRRFCNDGFQGNGDDEEVTFFPAESCVEGDEHTLEGMLSAVLEVAEKEASELSKAVDPSVEFHGGDGDVGGEIAEEDSGQETEDDEEPAEALPTHPTASDGLAVGNNLFLFVRNPLFVKKQDIKWLPNNKVAHMIDNEPHRILGDSRWICGSWCHKMVCQCAVHGKDCD